MFRMESEEHMQSIRDGLGKLSASSPNQEVRDTYETVFRAAHSLKGAARTIGLTEIEPIGLSIEKMFGLMKQEELIPSAELNALLLKTISSLKVLIDTLNDEGRITGDRSEVIRLIEEAASQVKTACEGA